MIQSVRLGIWTDMSIDEKDLTLFDIAVAVPEVDLSLPEGFDLRSEQGNPRLISLFDKIVKKCLFVLTNQLLFFWHLLTRPPHPSPLPPGERC